MRDPDCDPFTEHHEPDRLEYRFELLRGIPFPSFVRASAEFPELRVEAEWDQAGKKGGATIENGRLVEKWTGKKPVW